MEVLMYTFTSNYNEPFTNLSSQNNVLLLSNSLSRQQQSTATAANYSPPRSAISYSSRDRVSFSKEYTEGQVSTDNFFTSYVDLLRQQQISRAMLTQAKSGDSDRAGTSTLQRYQIMQYEQKLPERLFGLNGDIFQSLVDFTI
jgi:hypothetical protein